MDELYIQVMMMLKMMVGGREIMMGVMYFYLYLRNYFVFFSENIGVYRF